MTEQQQHSFPILPTTFYFFRFYLVFVDFCIVGNAISCNGADGKTKEDAGNSRCSLHFLGDRQSLHVFSSLNCISSLLQFYEFYGGPLLYPHC